MPTFIDLPPEVVSSIITTTVSPNAQAHFDANLLHPAVVISCVSSQWRVLTLSTPAGWTSVFIRIRTPDITASDEGGLAAWDTALERVVKRMAIHVSRAQNLPLDLNLDLDNDDTDRSYTYRSHWNQRFLDELQARAPHWRTMRIHLTFEASLSFHLLAIPGISTHNSRTSRSDSKSAHQAAVQTCGIS